MESYKEAQKNKDLKRRLWSGKCTEEDLLNKGYIKVKKSLIMFTMKLSFFVKY